MSLFLGGREMTRYTLKKFKPFFDYEVKSTSSLNKPAVMAGFLWLFVLVILNIVKQVYAFHAKNPPPFKSAFLAAAFRTKKLEIIQFVIESEYGR